MFKILSILILLAGCGFKPMYEKTLYNDLSDKTSQIAINPVKIFDGHYGIELRNSLLNDLTPLGKPLNPEYILDITLSEPSILDYTLKADGTASSYEVRMNAKYKLIQKSDGKILIDNQASTSNSYNILQDQFSTEMLKNNSIKLAIGDISKQIYFSIISYFSEK